MYAVLLCLSSLLSVGFCQVESEETYLVSGVKAVEADALSYKFPKDLCTSFKVDHEYADCVDFGTYDFIIIGAGSAGTVLANRLSEISGFRILILEAGTWENAFTDMPGLTDYWRASNYSWGYNVVPQKNFRGYLNQSIEIPRGKALGGSSVINAMIYARGNRKDFDKWAALGNPGWSYDDVLPYFMKSENATFNGSDDGYHGHNGSLHVEYTRVYDQVGSAFLEAAKSLDNKVLDYNGKDQMGFDRLQMNEINGVRDSGSKAFLKPAQNRQNLNISSKSFVLKILIDDTDTARGVKFISNGTLYYAKACKEVILSAGTLQTPQILMLSGIGPYDHLKEMGIPAKKHLPVGDNLWDHLIYSTQAYSINYTYTSENTSTQVVQYLKAEGPLTSPDSVQCVGYVSNTGNKTVPDIEMVLHTGKPSVQSYDYYKQLHRYTEETVTNVCKPAENISQWSVHHVLLHAESRGTVRLASSNPCQHPDVDPRYFSESADVDTMLAGIRKIDEFANTPALQKYNSKKIKVVHPLCSSYEYDSNDFWKCMIVNLAETVHHFGGTCKMGPSRDRTTVVDAKLRVHGIKHLRVADCSVIPVTLSGHTNAPAYMIGEKAADIIKEEYRFPCSACESCSWNNGK